MEINQKKLDFIKTLPTEMIKPLIIVTGDDGLIHASNGVEVLNNGSIIAGDGFGYEWDGERHVKFPHHGGVKIGKDVVFHGNACVDRASIGGEFTEIGDGTRIDNLVHIAHNVKIGKHCLIIAGAVIGGSAVIGDRVYVGMGALIKNKVKIGDDAVIGMGAVVLKDVPAGWTVIGNPAKRLEK